MMLIVFLFSDKIAKVADVFDCYVCEVGAGPGSLTRSVLQAGARHVAAVELDKRFLPSLQVILHVAEHKRSARRTICIVQQTFCASINPFISSSLHFSHSFIHFIMNSTIS